jgi:hypothetical protein
VETIPYVIVVCLSVLNQSQISLCLWVGLSLLRRRIACLLRSVMALRRFGIEVVEGVVEEGGVAALGVGGGSIVGSIVGEFAD